MPAEFHAGFHAGLPLLDDILIVMEIGVIADGGPADFRHKVTEDKCL